MDVNVKGKTKLLSKTEKVVINTLKACLVEYNGDYIGIGICITNNIRCCNVLLVIVHLFGDNTIIEPWRQWNV